MNRLFWGLFFVLLDVDITVGRAVFEVLPDFAGYFLLMKGMEELASEYACFEKSRHVAFGLFLVSLIAYGAGLLNSEAMTKVWLWVLELGCMGVFLWLLRQTVQSIPDREGRLNSLYPIVAVVLVLRHLLNWMPLVGSVCGVAATVLSAVFLLAFWKAIKKSAE